MNNTLFSLVSTALLTSFFLSTSSAAPPVVSNVRAAQRAGTKLVDVTYDVADPDNATVTVSVAVSNDGGLSYGVPVVTLTGDYGPAVKPGTSRRIVWNAGLDWNGRFTAYGRVRVTAQDAAPDDGSPPGMALIPGGGFAMGDPPNTRGITVSAFYMDRYEVSFALWSEVLQWAFARGYVFDSSGAAQAGNHPIQTVSWYDAVKWCNARSEREGRTPVYYTNTDQTAVYRSGKVDIGSAMVKWGANGYRLPTEAEWEKAARGGAVAQHFPWPSPNSGDSSGGSLFLDGSKANYRSSGDPFENNFVGTTPVGYYSGKQTPAGVDMANGYGLYDMAGNVWEWCWDWHGDYSTTALTNPSGPLSGTGRVLRGGCWDSGRFDVNAARRELRCAFRTENSAGAATERAGFRSVLRLP